MSDTPLHFNGTFTDEHLRKMQWLMKISGFKPKDMAYVLNCSDSAMRLWLNGRNRRCQTHFVPAFQIIFSGELDYLFKRAGDPDSAPDC